MASNNEYQDAGLFDPATDEGTGRIELLQWLERQGFSIDEMVEAHARNNLAALAGDQRIVPGERLTPEEAVAASGLDPERLKTFANAFGFMSADRSNLDDFGLTKAEASMLGTFGAVLTMFSDEEALGFVRVVGSSVARLSEAAVLLFLFDIESPHIESEGSELELATKMLDAIDLLDEFAPLIDAVMRRHVLQSVQRTRQATIDNERRLQRYAVGFIDLVGFTPISRNMSSDDLGAFIRDFEGRAHDAVTAAGARLVKLIGDEVMFITPDPDSACEVAQALMTSFRTEHGGDVLPRGGLAYGNVLMQGGDYYGEIVNLASRLADTAVPMELLVSGPFGDAATHLDFEPAGRRQLKGFAEPVVVRSMLFVA